MKICYVLPQYYKNSAENFYHIVNFLNKLGEKVELYVIVERSDTEVVIDSAKQIFLLKPQTHLFNISRFFQLIKIYFLLYRKGINLFFIRASLTGVLPMIFANRLINFNRAQVVFWSCGQDVVPLSFRPTKKNLKRLLSKFLSKVVFKGINHLATGPEIMSDYYHNHYGIGQSKIITLYNDISPERFYPIKKPKEKSQLKQELLGADKKVMLFVHTFNRCRGADLLPAIAEKIKELNMDAMVVAIGRDGDYSEKLNAETVSKGLTGYLLNLGEVANRKIEKYYQLADLFLMPSRGEGFPRVLLESMACGCPPLSFNVGGVNNILPEDTLDDLVISSIEDSKFIDRSLEIIDNKKLLSQLSNSVLEKVKIYETQNIVDMYVEQLDRINK